MKASIRESTQMIPLLAVVALSATVLLVPNSASALSAQIDGVSGQPFVVMCLDRIEGVLPEERRDPNDLSPFPPPNVRLALAWNAAGAEYVLLPGVVKGRLPPSGSTDDFVAGDFEGVAIFSDGRVSRATGRCALRYDPGVYRGRYAGQGYSVERFVDRAMYFQSAHRASLRPKLSSRAVERIIIEALQQERLLGYPEQASGADLVVHTRDYQYHRDVCLADDCNAAEARRRVERRVAFSVRYDAETGQLAVRPSVLMRYRREGGDWVRDQDEIAASRTVSVRLVRRIRDALSK